MTDRTDSEIIATGPRDWEEAKFIQEVLYQAVQRATLATELYELSLYTRVSKQLLDLLPMVASLWRVEEIRMRSEVKPFYVKLSECSDSIRQVLEGTIPKHED